MNPTDLSRAAPSRAALNRQAAFTVAGVLAVVALLIAAMLWAYWPWMEQALATEEAPLAWLQSSLLWSCATLVLLLSLVERDARRGWVLMAVMLFAAALDERFMGHERLKDWLLFQAFDGDPQRMGSWGDAPMLGYAVAGLLVLWWLRGRAWRDAELGLMVAAVLAGAVALGMDLRGHTLALQAVEECFEALAETLFFCGLLLRARRGVVRP